MRDTKAQYYEELGYLGGGNTPIRIGVLSELSNSSPLYMSELEDIFVNRKSKSAWEFSVSKRTLKRNIEGGTSPKTTGLIEKGLVKDISKSREESKYIITPFGQLLLEDLKSLFDTIHLSNNMPAELEPFLDIVLESGVNLDKNVIEDLFDADIYLKTATRDEVFGKGKEFISRSDYFRGISWVCRESYVDQYYEYLVEQGKQAEFILTPEVVEELVSSYAKKWREVLETGRLSVYEHGDLSFGITIVDHGIAWGYFEDPDGDHKAELVSESDLVRDWALEFYEEIKKESKDVTEQQLKQIKEYA